MANITIKLLNGSDIIYVSDISPMSLHDNYVNMRRLVLDNIGLVDNKDDTFIYNVKFLNDNDEEQIRNIYLEKYKNDLVFRMKINGFQNWNRSLNTNELFNQLIMARDKELSLDEHEQNIKTAIEDNSSELHYILYSQLFIEKLYKTDSVLYAIIEKIDKIDFGFGEVDADNWEKYRYHTIRELYHDEIKIKV